MTSQVVNAPQQTLLPSNKHTMPRIPQQAQTDGSTTFNPDSFFEAWSKDEITAPYDNNFRRFIIKAFGLPYDDEYGYQATSEVSLLQAQTYIEFGAQGGLHAWYRDAEGKEVGLNHSTRVEMKSYTKHSPKHTFRDILHLRLPT